MGELSAIVQLFARPRGALQWECPNCGNLHGATQQAWRTGILHCFRCEQRFRIGIAFCTPGDYRCLYVGVHSGQTVNQINRELHSFYETKAGRVYGRLDFECPACQSGQKGIADYDLGTVVCTNCRAVYGVQLLLYKVPTGRPTFRVPLDWTPKGAA
jgi:transcription elongation factor Elf1